MPSSQVERADAFRAMHRKERPILVLPTAWDAASARLIQDAGAAAIATTSLGMANVLGYSDGEAFFPPDEMLWLAARLIRAVEIPVSLDIEAGYGDPERMTAEVIRVGAVGLNIEDRVGQEETLLPLEQAADAVRRVREVARAKGVPIVINARTDCLARGGSVEEAIRRGRAYLEAGADCVLAVNALDSATIARLVAGIPGPLNVTPKPGSPTIGELQALGVRRASTMVFGAAIAFARRAALELLEAGTFELIAGQRPFPDLNTPLSQRHGL